MWKLGATFAQLFFFPRGNSPINPGGTDGVINNGQDEKTIKFHGTLFEAAEKLMGGQPELVEQDADP